MRIDEGPQDAVRRARAAAAAAFGVIGLVAASWAARVPAVQDRLELSPGGLAVAVLGIEAGALLGLPLGGALVTRRGSRASTAAGFAVYAPALLVAALAPSLAWLTLGLAVWAAANSVVDVALNAQGVELERRYGRPVLSGLHAAQGAGLVAGASTATAAAALDVPLLAHLVGVAGVALAVGVAAAVPLVQEPRGRRPRGQRVGRRRRVRLLPLGAVAFCAFLVDGAATSWAAVHLRAAHGADEGLAAAAYLVFAAALVLGRLPADRLSARSSRTGVVRVCGLLAAAGTAVAVLAPSATLALGGWALVGLGVAPLAPLVLGAAPDASRDLPAPVAIATVTTVGYLGSFTGPPLVGALAGVVDLDLALALVAAAGLAASLLARHVPPRPSAIGRTRDRGAGAR